MASPAKINEQELVEADAKFKKALELRDSDLETAVELLGQVLEARNKAYGENALECADAYLYYGECLFEQAQAATDIMGDQMTRAVNQRARAMAAAEDAAAGDNADDDAVDPAEAEAAASEPSAAEAGNSKAADTSEPTATAADATEPAADMSEPAAAAGEPASTEDVAAPTGDVPEGGKEQAAAADDADVEGSSSSSDESDDDADGVGDEEGAAGEGEGQGAPEVTGEGDDMVLAWEMLELARLIYNNNGGAEAHANKLADCHMYIADILAEQEKFEAAVEEYKTAQEMLARVEGGHNAHRRRAAELEFKKATSLQLLDAPAEALAAMQSAHALLTTQLAAVNAQLSSTAGSSCPDVSGAVASAAFASILGGYTAPAAPAADTAEEKAAGGETQAGGDVAANAAKAAVAKLHQQVTDIKGALESIQERMEELKTAVEEHVSMKEQLAKIFAAVAADDGAGSSGSDGAQLPAVGGDGVVETVGFGLAGSSKAAAGEVKDIGVIGKGKRMVPTPVEPAAAAVATEAVVVTGEGSKKRPLSDLSSSDQEPGTEGDAGAAADGAAAKAAAAAAAATADRDAAPKRAKA